MPRPVFDIEQYELRLLKPDVFTKEQSDRLNLVTSRVNQQLDWTAQLLGMNGTSYWGLPDLKADGKYTWHGLPETPNEKRQLQTVAFGVYDKDKAYEDRPAPFNRSRILASGDQDFQIWEKDGVTYLSPLGGTRDATFSAKPYVFAGGSYVFDEEVEFEASSDARDYYSYTFQGIDRLWTRVFVNSAGGLIGVRKKGSTAKYFYMIPLSWEDISDWRSPKVLDDFIGLWGNKGNNFSLDAVNDALDVHGFDEVQALRLTDSKSCLNMKDLLGLVGLRPTPWTGYYNQKFGFRVNNSTTIYPLPPQTQDIPDQFEYHEYDGCNFNMKFEEVSAIPDPDDFDLDTSYDNAFYDRDPAIAECSLDNGTFEAFYDYRTTPQEDVDEGIYNRLWGTNFNCYSFTEPAIKELCFEYIPDDRSPCALLDLPCIEWLFDPGLNNGIYDDYDVDIDYYAWADADDGTYDHNPLRDCYYAVNQGAVACEDQSAFCSFNDGIYGDPANGGTEYFEPECDPLPLEPCPVVDGGYLEPRSATPPNYAEECYCPVECCDINNGIYTIANGVPIPLDGVVDGGLYLYYDTCEKYDNDVYDRDPLDHTCSLDNGLFTGLSLSTKDSGVYDRFIYLCPECEEDDPPTPPPPEPCPLDPVRVNLEQIYTDFKYKMEPSVANALTPLRVWKSRPLTCTDSAPGDGLVQYNYLVADENKGPDPFDSFRYYLRLPLEYVRNGKFWNRAISVASNQGYFSAPSHLSETQNDPEIFRPRLWDEAYDNYSLNPSDVYYAEPYLVSTIRTDSQGYEAGFEDAAVTFEQPEVNPFAPAVIMDYDPFQLRIPFTNGDWKGQYCVAGSVTDDGFTPRRSGFLEVDIDDGVMSALPVDEYPVWDESSVKRPNLEFPDSPDEASVKDYVVSYAYFCADFSASDDPVFDPDNEICWRKQEVACYTATNEGEAGFDQITDCTLKPRPINSAYLLHDDGTTETESTPAAVLTQVARAANEPTGGGNSGGGGGY